MRIHCGDPEDAYEPGQRCRDCGVGTGEEHWDGCCVERCSQRHRNEDGYIQQAMCCTECWEEEREEFDEMMRLAYLGGDE